MKLLFTEVFGVSFGLFCFALIYDVEYCMRFLLLSVRREAVDTLKLNRPVQNRKLIMCNAFSDLVILYRILYID